MEMFPAPNYEYLPQAINIIDALIEVYGSESNYFDTEGKLITEREEVKKHIDEYLEELGPEIKAISSVNFSTNYVASTSISFNNYTEKISINVKVPIEYREGRIKGILHHEIGTHLIRRFNEMQ